MISVDLTKEYPRSARDKWQGVVMLGRAIDKGKAKAAGTNGEYNFDCPMDQAVFEFLNLKGDELLEVIKKSDSDAHIEDYKSNRSTNNFSNAARAAIRSSSLRICATRLRRIAPTS
jgi:hypothetical protein